MESDFNYHGPVVVFDIDDTLFRERDFCRSGFRHILKRVETEIGEIPANLYDKMNVALTNRQNPFDVFEKELKPLYHRGGSEWNLNSYIQDYRTHRPDIHLEEGFPQLLRLLQISRIVIGIITDGRSNSQRRKIEALGLEEFVAPSNILISEETGFDKTSMEPFGYFVRKYPEASRFLYIADNPAKDFFQPNLLGWTTVQVPDRLDNVHPACLPENDLFLPSRKIAKIEDLRHIIFE